MNGEMQIGGASPQNAALVSVIEGMITRLQPLPRLRHLRQRPRG